MKNNKNDNNIMTIGSILIGLLTVGLLGFSVYSLLTRLGLLAPNSLVMITIVFIGASMGVFFGIKYPITTEAVSFAITALIMIQAYWDATYDISNGFYATRVIIGIIALSIFILNMFTGRLKKGTAKKQIRRTLGVR